MHHYAGRGLARVPSALAVVCAAAGLVWAAPALGEVTVERVTYLNWPNCFRISNGTVEVVVTTDVGPRIIRYGFPKQDNMLAEFPPDAPGVQTEFGEWKPYGGHRLWVAPEARPRSYAPDNSPVVATPEGDNGLRLTAPVEAKTGIEKEMVVSLAPTGTQVTIVHRITNKGIWGIEAAPWALTIMRTGGVTIIPQEPYISHDLDAGLPPARPMVLWPYTDLGDPRWSVGKRYLRLKTDETINEPQKVGVLNKQGWAAYARGKQLFVKRYAYVPGATYTDYGCNTETYTSGGFMEIETLGPLAKLEPGATAIHEERWFLFAGIDIGTTEAALDAAITPAIAQTK